MNARADPSQPKSRAKPAERRFRRDIQVLRGIAVLAVVIFHAWPGALPKGLLGVDVFFVISGYLMTGMILRELQEGSFNFLRFYYRRAKRLLPACYSTLLAVTLVGYVAMTREQWSEYFRQLLGALTFTANFVFAAHVNYFGGKAQSYPLLHIWSLSLEEQYYFILPVALALVAARYRSWLLIAAAALSFVACVWLASGYRIPFVHLDLFWRERIAFYMLPTRAWELLLGSICGYVMLRNPAFHVPAALKYCALAAMAFAFAVGVDIVHPRTDAAIATLATCVVLLGSTAWLTRNVLTNAVAIVGDWSYSLYLVHWPILSFAYQAYAGDVPDEARMAAVTASVFFAWLQFRFVETPFRKTQWPAPRFTGFQFATAACVVAAAALPAAISLSVHPPELTRQLKPNYGLAQDCSQTGTVWTDLPACKTSPDPVLAIWGDSYAMQLVEGLAAEGIPLVQITRSACAPIDRISAIDQSVAEAAECQAFTRDAMQKILRMPSVRAVLVSSTFRPLLGGSELLVDGTTRRDYAESAARLENQLRAISAAGKTPILVAPMPRFGFDPAVCNAREIEGLPLMAHNGCSPLRTKIEPELRRLNAILAEVAGRTNTRFYDPASVLCRDRCDTRVGGQLLYRDEAHLTRWGSRYAMARLGIGQTILGPDGNTPGRRITPH